MKPLAADEIGRWVNALLRRHGVKMYGRGMLDAPAKWCAIVSDLSTALLRVAEDGTLPEILPPKPAAPTPKTEEPQCHGECGSPVEPDGLCYRHSGYCDCGLYRGHVGGCAPKTEEPR